MSKNKQKTLDWSAFQSLGNPDNVPDEVPNKKSKYDYSKMSVRIYLDKKHRGGKAVTLIKGLNLMENDLKDLSKELKKLCGVGGSSKNKEIILQGNHRDKILVFIQNLGVKDVKKAGG